MNLSKSLYFGDLVAAPIVIIVLAALALAGRDVGAVGLWIVALFAGIGAWTLVEYAVHRWLYHRVPFFEKFHDAHHADPRALIGTPSFVSIAIVLGVFLLPLLPAGLVAASGFASGALLGYTAYMLVHHLSHHMGSRTGTLLYQARLRHLAHHYRGTPGNYGVTTSFWDRVFATNLEPRRRHAPVAMPTQQG
jgi:sterol desaturase/sphingolipid hydroxylase (fatty acid hydroxylase superfamily)